MPWIVSNPIYVGLARHAVRQPAMPEPLSRIPARTGEAAAESGPNDTSTRRDGPLVDPRRANVYRRSRDQLVVRVVARHRGRQFAAVAIPVVGGLARSIACGSASRRRADARVGAAARAGRQHRAVGKRRSTPMPSRGSSTSRSRRSRPIGVTSSAQPPLDAGRLAAVRGRYVEHAAGHEAAADDLRGGFREVTLSA